MLVNSVDILLVEDNLGDIELTREALKESKFNNKLYVVNDGQEALDFLFKKGAFSKVITPDLILLDLNLPKKNGHEVLKEIKENKKLRRIPVVMLTTSKSEEDVFRSYDLHANCFITKPLDLNSFIDIVKQLENFWVSLVKLPNKK